MGQFLGRLTKSLGSPRRREGSGVLKKEERTNYFFSTFLSLSHIKWFLFSFLSFNPGTDDYTTNNSV